MSKKEEMYAHVEAYQQSDLSQKDYCQIHHLKVATLGYWIAKKKLEKSQEEEGDFVMLQSEETPADHNIVVEFPNGIKVHVSNLHFLQQIIHLY